MRNWDWVYFKDILRMMRIRAPFKFDLRDSGLKMPKVRLITLAFCFLGVIIGSVIFGFLLVENQFQKAVFYCLGCVFLTCGVLVFDYLRYLYASIIFTLALLVSNIVAPFWVGGAPIIVVYGVYCVAFLLTGFLFLCFAIIETIEMSQSLELSEEKNTILSHPFVHSHLLSDPVLGYSINQESKDWIKTKFSFAALSQNLQDGFLLLDTHGKVRSCNLRAQQLLGFPIDNKSIQKPSLTQLDSKQFQMNNELDGGFDHFLFWDRLLELKAFVEGFKPVSVDDLHHLLNSHTSNKGRGASLWISYWVEDDLRTLQITSRRIKGENNQNFDLLFLVDATKWADLLSV